MKKNFKRNLESFRKEKTYIVLENAQRQYEELSEKIYSIVEE